ncbi:TetR/AcrR family transcriptional regulator [Parafrankia sp. EUN1f]|uniref:TetR/AcrR family transcriptional regulator n=1 Tax=Parafrankia sp. EUN1f TaxID=102897 RepID=UPI0001C44221|nr:TetR/AcrR family transcriptional regulator [Parafrankia sp. EUN1f]EFC85777.1 transcriptional regulator, TetR family [Parafrankia sp. EUN1f]
MTTQPEQRAPFDWQSYEDLELHPILSAALAAFYEHGYHGTTVRDIAGRVGLTMPALYYHYGSKEGMLLALLDIGMDDLLAHIEGGQEAAGDDPLTQLENFVSALCLHNIRRQNFARVHAESRFLGPDRRKDYFKKRDEVFSTLLGILERGNRAGRFALEEPHTMALAILGMVNGIVEWFRPAGAWTPDDIAERYTGLALRLADVRAGRKRPQ